MPSETVSDELLAEMQRDCGIANPPTQETYWFRKALAGEGPHAYDWSDKPHRLVFDLCHLIEADAALRSKPVASGATIIEQMSDEEFNRDRSDENPNVGKVASGVEAMLTDAPINAPASEQEGVPAWLQVNNMFSQNHVALPPSRLRDEIVQFMLWAWYGKRLHEALALLPKATAPVVSEPIGYISEKSLAYLRSGDVSGAVSVEPVKMRVANIPVYASPHPHPQPMGVTEEMRARIIDALEISIPHTFEFDAESGGYYDTDLSRELRELSAAMKEA